MALSNTDFDGILAALIPAWASNRYASLFVRQNPAWEIFLEKGRIQSGGFGTKIVEPTSFPTNTGPQVNRRGTNVLQENQTALMTGSTAAEYIAAMYDFDYALSMYEMKQFGADTEKANWAQWNVEQAMERIFNFVEADWWTPAQKANSGGTSAQYVGSLQTYINSGTTSSTDGGALPPALAAQQIAPFVDNSAVNNPDGVDQTGKSAVTVVGNIERAAAGAAYWAVPLLSPSSSQALNIQYLDQIYNLAVTGKKEPDLIILHRDLHAVLMNLSTFGGTNGGQVISDPNSARMGHRKLFYRNAEVIMDDRCPTSGYVSGTGTARNYNIFALNTEFLAWRLDKKKPVFRHVDDPRPIKRYVSDWMLQFTMKGAGRHHARHCNIAAPT